MRISDWSSDVCSSDLASMPSPFAETQLREPKAGRRRLDHQGEASCCTCLMWTYARYDAGCSVLPHHDLRHAQASRARHGYIYRVLNAPSHRPNGRASCRARVCQSVEIHAVAVTL